MKTVDAMHPLDFSDEVAKKIEPVSPIVHRPLREPAGDVPQLANSSIAQKIAKVPHVGRIAAHVHHQEDHSPIAREPDDTLGLR